MKRRQFIRTLGATGALVSLSGCLSAPSAKATFTYSPANPVVGESVVFDATGSVGKDYEWEFGKSEEYIPDAEGKKVAHRFSEPGAYTASLTVVSSPDIAPFGGYDDCATPLMTPGCSKDESTKRIYVQSKSASDSESTQLRIETNKVNILLKGNKTNVSIREKAFLQFSAANLIGNRELTIQLILETPSGISVTSTAFIESGAGQYTSTFVLAPGESRGVRIQIEPNKAGQYTIIGHAIYYFGNDTKNRKSRNVKIPITVTS